MVMGLFTGTVAYPFAPFSAAGTATRAPASSGMNFEMGPSRRNRPSSKSVITAAVVIAFVWEAMRKMASGGMGVPFSGSSLPNAS